MGTTTQGEAIFSHSIPAMRAAPQVPVSTLQARLGGRFFRTGYPHPGQARARGETAAWQSGQAISGMVPPVSAEPYAASGSIVRQEIE
jgi:hypothetical protein